MNKAVTQKPSVNHRSLPSNIAVLGMGAMGSRMASALIEAGHHVTVWNLVPQACAPLVAKGARMARTPREAVRFSDFVIAMVWDDEASQYVWLDPEVGAIEGMRSRAIALECATLTIEHERKIAKACEERGLEFVSAPMSGSLPEADAKTLVFTVGASAHAFDRVEPILLAMGSKINHVGGPLDGISEKLIINGKLGIEYLAAAEIVALMKVANMDSQKRMAIKATTAPFSARGLREAQFMLDGDTNVRVKVNQIIKDLQNQVQQFEAYHVPCPLHRAVIQQFESARDRGFGECDSTVLAHLFEQDARVAMAGNMEVAHRVTVNTGTPLLH